jgi:hypothetical protein
MIEKQKLRHMGKRNRLNLRSVRQNHLNTDLDLTTKKKKKNRI